MIEGKLKKGLFKESMEDFDRIMAMDFEYADLYENISCVKFWINRVDILNKKLKEDWAEYCEFLDSSYKKFCIFIRDKDYKGDLISIKAIHFWNSQSILESVKWRAVSDYPERSTSAEHCWRSLLAARQNNYQIIVTKPIIHEMN